MESDSQDKLELGKFIPFRLAALAQKVTDSCAEMYSRQFGVTIAQWRVLAVLAEHETLHSKDVGNIASMDKSKVSRAVQQLEDRQLLTRQKDPSDNRASFLTLTTEGLELYFKIVPQVRLWEEEFMSGVDESEHGKVLEFIEQLETTVNKIALRRPVLK